MKVVITGLTGQDGSHMADYLLKNTHAQIYGIVRRLSTPNKTNIAHLVNNPRVTLMDGDITDVHSISGVIESIKPDYFINLAANSFVGTSWKTPVHVFETNAMSVLHQLEAIRKYSPQTRYYQAGSSEEFGDVQYCPQDEKHPLRPRSPYGAAKASARHLVKVYRESYGIYAVAGWLFNHEGIRRGEQFVTRKITKGVARIAKEPRDAAPIVLGNLESKRDWSDAEDFVDGIWKMLHQSCPVDYVLASGETHTIREFVEEAFACANFKNCRWLKVNSPVDEAYWSDEFDTCLVEVSPVFYRPNEVDILLGNANKARAELGWHPKTTFQGLVRKMVHWDLLN